MYSEPEAGLNQRFDDECFPGIQFHGPEIILLPKASANEPTIKDAIHKKLPTQLIPRKLWSNIHDSKKGTRPSKEPSHKQRVTESSATTAFKHTKTSDARLPILNNNAKAINAVMGRHTSPIPNLHPPHPNKSLKAGISVQEGIYQVRPNIDGKPNDIKFAQINRPEETFAAANNPIGELLPDLVDSVMRRSSPSAGMQIPVIRRMKRLIPVPVTRLKALQAPESFEYLLDPPVIKLSLTNPSTTIQFINKSIHPTRFHWLPVPIEIDGILQVNPKNTRWCKTVHRCQYMEARVSLQLPFSDVPQTELFLTFTLNNKQISWPIVIEKVQYQLKIHNDSRTILFSPKEVSHSMKIENLGLESTTVSVCSEEDPFRIIGISQCPTEIGPGACEVIVIHVNEGSVLRNMDSFYKHRQLACYVAVYSADEAIVARIPVSIRGFSRPIEWESGSVFEFDPCPVTCALQKHFNLQNPNPFPIKFKMRIDSDATMSVHPMAGAISSYGFVAIQVRICAGTEKDPAKFSASVLAIQDAHHHKVAFRIRGLFFTPALSVSPSHVHLREHMLVRDKQSIPIRVTNPLPVHQLVAMDPHPCVTFDPPCDGGICLGPGDYLQGHLHFTAHEHGQISSYVNIRGLVPYGPTTLTKVTMTGYIWQPIAHVSHPNLQIPATGPGTINSASFQLDWNFINERDPDGRDEAVWMIWNGRVASLMDCSPFHKERSSVIAPSTENSDQLQNPNVNCMTAVPDQADSPLAVHVVRTEGPMADILSMWSFEADQDLTKFLHIHPAQGKLSTVNPSASVSIMFMPPKPVIKLTDISAQHGLDPVIPDPAFKRETNPSLMDSATNMNRRLTGKGGNLASSSLSVTSNSRIVTDKKPGQGSRPVSPTEAISIKPSSSCMLSGIIVYRVPIMVFLTHRNPQSKPDNRPNWVFRHVEVTCQITTAAFSVVHSVIELGDVPVGSINTAKVQVVNHHPSESIRPTMEMRDPFRLSKPVPEISPLSTGDILVSLQSNAAIGSVKRKICVKENGTRSLITLSGNVYAPELKWNFDPPTMGHVMEHETENSSSQSQWAVGDVYIGEQHTLSVTVTNNTQYAVPVRKCADTSASLITTEWKSDSIPQRGSTTILITLKVEHGISIGVPHTIIKRLACQGSVHDVSVLFTPYQHGLNIMGMAVAQENNSATVVFPLSWSFVLSVGNGITREAVWMLQWPHELRAVHIRPMILQTKSAANAKAKVKKDSSATPIGLGSITFGKFIPPPEAEPNFSDFVNNLFVVNPAGPTVVIPTGESVAIDLVIKTAGNMKVLATKSNDPCPHDIPRKLRPLIDTAPDRAIFVSIPWGQGVPDLDGTFMEMVLAGGQEPEINANIGDITGTARRLIKMIFQNVIVSACDHDQEEEPIDWTHVLDAWESKNH